MNNSLKVETEPFTKEEAYGIFKDLSYIYFLYLKSKDKNNDKFLMSERPIVFLIPNTLIYLDCLLEIQLIQKVTKKHYMLSEGALSIFDTDFGFLIEGLHKGKITNMEFRLSNSEPLRLFLMDDVFSVDNGFFKITQKGKESLWSILKVYLGQK